MTANEYGSIQINRIKFFIAQFYAHTLLLSYVFCFLLMQQFISTIRL